ncbi:MAG: tetratricopeptide repeat protein [Gemmatimonadetes bacterium]|nr:tetratricopeptide repeat protein [Gemmatimonadota bacterium]
MARIDVIHIDDYRVRREQRRRDVFALYGADYERSRLVLQLWRAVSLLGADRAAAVWVDEYGPGLAHVYCLLDLAADPPRRSFSLDLLRAAWAQGVPGMWDVADADRSYSVALPDGVRSGCAIALGSDGARAWFLVVDSHTARQPVSASVCAELMFSAGECAGLVLHRDLGEPRQAATKSAESIEEQRRTAFAGWPVLRDVEGRETEEAANDRIARRFVVVRLVRTLVEEDFALDPESLEYQIAGAFSEVQAAPVDDPERPLWEAILNAARSGRRDALANAVLALGDYAERLGHVHGAREIYRNAYDVAVAAGQLPAATDAAAFYARSSRKLADWSDAETWYQRAFEMASAVEDHTRAIAVLTGLANSFRVRGNLPRAREILDRALELGQRANDRHALGQVHHGLLVVEKHFERLIEASTHGWKAVQLYETESDRARALFDLADVLLQARAWTPARDAYAIVAPRLDQAEEQLLAFAGLAYTNAMLGDAAQFRRWSGVLDHQGTADAPPPIRAQILYYLGLSHAVLREGAEARRLLQLVMTEAETHKLNKLFFQAEAAIRELDEAEPNIQKANPESSGLKDPRLAELSTGLGKLRAELIDAAVP